MKRNFNPRSLAGATATASNNRGGFTFQSTLPRGSDGSQAILSLLGDNFNPRSLAGATLMLLT